MTTPNGFDFKKHTHPDNLERYSFLWSEVRLLVAALALFLGGIPPIYLILRIPPLYGLITLLLTLCWLISGAAAIYLVYRWNQNKQLVFGRKDTKDTTAFFVSVISGINLGLAGLLRANIGMTITRSRVVFDLVGLLYIVCCVHLYNKWMSHGKKLF
jgi:uncharacterized membrane protein YuzA (DUF378 family)